MGSAHLPWARTGSWLRWAQGVARACRVDKRSASTGVPRRARPRADHQKRFRAPDDQAAPGGRLPSDRLVYAPRSSTLHRRKARAETTTERQCTASLIAEPVRSSDQELPASAPAAEGPRLQAKPGSARDAPQRSRATRNPRRALVVVGDAVSLKADRAWSGELAQDPPRITRRLQPGLTQAEPSAGAR